MSDRTVTPTPSSAASVSRRRFLVAGGAGLLAVACSSDGDGDASPDPTVTSAPTETPTVASGGDADTAADPTTQPTAAEPTDDAAAGPAPLNAADFDALAVCALTPSAAAGPFPIDEQLDRRDVTEGYPGHPMRLGFRVVDSSCAPIDGATVEIWHTDAGGDYSAFDDGGDGKDEGAGTTFMRGSQTAGADGIVEFQTIYPGWYPGRPVHIHLRVYVAGSRVLTSQVYFDDDYTAAVFTEPDYVDFGQPDTTAATDRIAGDPAADGTLLALSRAETTAGPGTLALLNLGVET